MPRKFTMIIAMVFVLISGIVIYQVIQAQTPPDPLTHCVLALTYTMSALQRNMLPATPNLQHYGRSPR